MAVASVAGSSVVSGSVVHAARVPSSVAVASTDTVRPSNSVSFDVIWHDIQYLTSILILVYILRKTKQETNREERDMILGVFSCERIHYPLSTAHPCVFYMARNV